MTLSDERIAEIERYCAKCERNLRLPSGGGGDAKTAEAVERIKDIRTLAREVRDLRQDYEASVAEADALKTERDDLRAALREISSCLGSELPDDTRWMRVARRIAKNALLPPAEHRCTPGEPCGLCEGWDAPKPAALPASGAAEECPHASVYGRDRGSPWCADCGQTVENPRGGEGARATGQSPGSVVDDSPQGEAEAAAAHPPAERCAVEITGAHFPQGSRLRVDGDVTLKGCSSEAAAEPEPVCEHVWATYDSVTRLCVKCNEEG